MKSLPGRREDLMVLLLLIVGTCLRAAWLTTQSLWSDEALTLVVSRSDGLWKLLRTLESAPPLHFIIMRWWLGLFPDPLLGMRLFSLLCGTASLWVFHRLACRVVPHAATAALFIAVFSSYWIHGAQDGRFYSLFLLIALLQTSVLWRLKDEDDPRLWAAYAVLASLGLYTHYFALFLVLAQAGIIAAYRIRGRRSLRPALACCAVVALLYLPWLPSLAAQASQRAGATLVVERFDLPQVAFIFGTMFADLSHLGLILIPWIKALGVLMLALLGAGAWSTCRRAGSAPAFLGSWGGGPAFCLAHIVLVLAAFPLVAMFVGIPLIQPRYFVFLSPFVYLFMARLTAPDAPWPRAARLLLEAVLLAGLAGYLASNRVFNPRLDLLARDAERLDASSPIIHLHPYHYLPMRYYYLAGRTHRLVPGHVKDVLDGENLPGYPGIIRVKDLPAVGPCLVMDPERRLRRARVWPSTGRELAGLMSASGLGSKEP